MNRNTLLSKKVSTENRFDGNIPVCGVTFEQCCELCLKNEKFVKEFNRLNGLSLGSNRSSLERAIDIACGYDPEKEAIPKFVEFVYSYVWIPYVESVKWKEQ